MGDGVIDFNELKNKVRDKDIEKFENYIFSLYDSLSRGEISMAELSKNIMKYMEDNNISQEKFLKIQQEMLKRYGLDSEYMETQLKTLGLDATNFDLDKNYEAIRKTQSFKEKYKNSIEDKIHSQYKIVNEVNNIVIDLQEENVVISSEGKVDLNDVEINEFLCSYKKLMEDKTLKVKLYQNVTEYSY
ncbi:DUF3867 domain-containing protein [Inconstantimicrobium mannanitabidum]|uniref:Uncharacterized protein n=1 Tax=Inconstantimicrobium mannanitabidum TaxID=1604901 RepID=A0ACB5R975_9CLOT|nr:DUF3867 domain-containing protein [Clostridium sp. TW13]GKX65737.1 hypothetical protein rsdtw13_09950 [Clostridium sp. TW13]